MKEGILLWGSVLMIGVAIVVYTLIANWLANRPNKQE